MNRSVPFSLLAIVLAGWLTGCASLLPAKAPAPAAPSLEQAPLEPDASPLEFRWLGEDAVLVDEGSGSRTLALFGNYISRRARQIARTRVSVWDDEGAWRSARASGIPSEDILAHKRAEYLKDSEPSPVDQFTVFDRNGEVIYERDFRDWPLTETDEP